MTWTFCFVSVPYKVVASRASGRLLDTQTPQKAPCRTPKFFVWNFLECQSLAYNWIFHLHIIPTTLYKDIVTYFDKFILVYGWNLKYIVVPHKNVDTQKIYNCQSWALGNPVSKSWLRPWSNMMTTKSFPLYLYIFKLYLSQNSVQYWIKPFCPALASLASCMAFD